MKLFRGSCFITNNEELTSTVYGSLPSQSFLISCIYFPKPIEHDGETRCLLVLSYDPDVSYYANNDLDDVDVSVQLMCYNQSLS